MSFIVNDRTVYGSTTLQTAGQSRIVRQFRVEFGKTEELDHVMRSLLQWKNRMGQAASGYHITYLCRVFKQETGRNIRDYINAEKVEEAVS